MLDSHLIINNNNGYDNVKLNYFESTFILFCTIIISLKTLTKRNNNVYKPKMLILVRNNWLHFNMNNFGRIKIDKKL